MGTFMEFKCKKCEYKVSASFGVGFLFPQVYEETIQATKNGELGEKIQKFLQENPDGAIDASNVLSVCYNCGNAEIVKRLSMYLPKENISRIEDDSNRRWSVGMPFYGAKYVDPFDLKKDYKFVLKYPHRCKNCGNKVKIFNEKNVKEMKCPKCDSIMELYRFGSCD